MQLEGAICVFCSGLRVVLTVAGSPLKEESVAFLQSLLSAGHALNNKLLEELVGSSVVIVVVSDLFI